MKSNITFTILLLFSLLSLSISSTIVNASIDVQTYTTSKDFTLTTSYDELTLCACSTKYDTFQVANTATWPAIYTVEIADANKNTISLSEQTFELYPGQTKEIFIYINADCDKGSDDIKIIVSSNLGVTKAIDKTITTNRCQNIEMILADYNQNVNPCESKSFEIVLHNVGPFADTYVLGSNYDNDGQITYSANSVFLNPNEYAKIIAKTNFDCSVYGEQNIIFTSKTLNNKLTANVNAKLNIQQNYYYDVRIGYDFTKVNHEVIDENVCNRQSSVKIPVVITNKGSVENTFTIDHDLIKNAKLVQIFGTEESEVSENTEFTLKKGESKIFFIDVDSTKYRYEEKTKENKIFLKSLNGNEEFDKKFLVKVNFKPCYEHDVKIYDYSNNKYNPLETCAVYEYKTEINVVNNGLVAEEYFLSLENAPSTVKLSKEIVRLSPGESTIVDLLITGPEENSKRKIIVKVVSSSQMVEYDSTWIKTYDSASCHDTDILKNKFNINYQDSIINVPVKNNGLVDNAYIITWTGSDIVDKTDLLLQLKKSDKGIVKLYLDSEGKSENKYNGTLSLKDASGTEYSRVITLNLEDKGLVRKAFEYFAFNNICRKATLAELIAIPLLIGLIILLYIRSPKYQYNFKNRLKSKLWILLGLAVLFLIGVAVVLTFAGLPKTQSQIYSLETDESKLIYEWLEDDKYVLDAGKFFYDPDNSTLKYTVSGLDNIKAVVSGKMITFYPDKDWSGTETARITATDNYGSSVTSPEFTLKVLDVPRKSYLELYNIYCWYVNLAIYLILLLLVFIAFFVKQEIRRRK
jgi:hypothetical protein